MVPIKEIKWPRVEINDVSSIAVILASEEYAACIEFFTHNAATQRSLVSPNLQALLYCLIRNMNPRHVFEIGTYRAGSSEAICRALHDNESGTLHTADPFGGRTVPPIIAAWPAPLQKRARFYPVNSMDFFVRMRDCNISPELIFIDGDHDYEFAAFDIESAARLIRPGGLIFVDNINQAGPYFALKDFLVRNPSWQSQNPLFGPYRPGLAYDNERTGIINTDSGVLRAPVWLSVNERLVTRGQIQRSDPRIRGIRLIVGKAASGTVHTQCVLRVFADELTEAFGQGSTDLTDAFGEIVVPLDEPLSGRVVGEIQKVTVEPWVSWSGSSPLQLLGEPVVY